MKIKVIRGLGNRLATEVLVNALAEKITPATNLGREYLYQNGFDKRNYSITLPLRDNIICGDLIEVNDASIGDVFQGRLKSWSISGTLSNDAVDITQSFDIERSVIEDE